MTANTEPSGNEKYPEIVKLLEIASRVETGRGVGRLDIIAAKTKLREGDLWAIFRGEAEVTDEIASAIAELID